MHSGGTSRSPKEARAEAPAHIVLLAQHDRNPPRSGNPEKSATKHNNHSECEHRLAPVKNSQRGNGRNRGRIRPSGAKTPHGEAVRRIRQSCDHQIQKLFDCELDLARLMRFKGMAKICHRKTRFQTDCQNGCSKDHTTHGSSPGKPPRREMEKTTGARVPRGHIHAPVGK